VLYYHGNRFWQELLLPTRYPAQQQSHIIFTSFSEFMSAFTRRRRIPVSNWWEADGMNFFAGLGMIAAVENWEFQKILLPKSGEKQANPSHSMLEIGFARWEADKVWDKPSDD
jgi:hypothetical protein